MAHLWATRQAEIAADPDLRAAAHREYERSLRRYHKMRLEHMLLRGRSRLLAMRTETNKARAKQRALRQSNLIVALQGHSIYQA